WAARMSRRPRPKAPWKHGGVRPRTPSAGGTGSRKGSAAGLVCTCRRCSKRSVWPRSSTTPRTTGCAPCNAPAPGDTKERCPVARRLQARSPEPEVDALRRGDEAAFVAAIQRYHGPLLRLAMAYVRDRDAAEDVVQEAWLTAIRQLERFEGRSSLRTWISGIVINLARARRRKESRVFTFTSFF